MILLWRSLAFIFLLLFFTKDLCTAQDYDEEEPPPAPPKALDTCNGIFLTYDFISRTKEYPKVKNVSAQAWSFNATATIMNTGTAELKAWKMFIGFQHREILVNAGGAVLVNGDDFPAPVGNGSYLSGYPQSDLKTSIDTAGDFSQIQARIELSGTQFGLKAAAIPMPKTIKLVNDGFKCPAPTHKKTSMYVCCVKDPKFKVKKVTTKFLPRQKGDLSISYDIIQAYENNYFAQITIENDHPLGRLDHWNLTWEWMRGEFIYSMKGAYTREIDYSDCIYGPQGQYYGQMDFSKVLNCQKKPIISDLPRERYNDTQVGKIPYCCRNGSLLPSLMDASESKAVFQMQVFKLPPDLNRTALYPPEKWKIVGVLNPNYKCGPAIRVDPTEFPDSSGLQAISLAIASWQVVCNISKPTRSNSRCCVSFSSYYNESVIPCNTCACGCPDKTKCNPDAQAMLVPPETLLVPYENRTEKTLAWAKLKHFHIPKPLPCGDNCGVSINWHVSTDYRNGWTARITLFNWEEINFENWFVAIQFKRSGRGYQKAYSFNGTFLPQLNNTIFLQGMPGMVYLMGETNGTDPGDPRVPGKQQTVISFTKKGISRLNIPKGDGFPTRLLFNGEECSLPTQFPTGGAANRYHVGFVQVLLTFVIILMITKVL
ncbi:hypothetical protein HS088_TW09G00230 [Tripterygium wilfordii]|uniref:COBRA C-terminal domain-containing protein n=1 Tax=Tripterygium wilfordii TaxID=458696 RepID=A0A7J7D7B0_TRIWF|nr:COBRA-like protein 10 [Tripterygium wilfordii]KAF5742188.1 hypothetical protein HS088_TW09G00230 [Tripterygium wilfordii]